MTEDIITEFKRYTRFLLLIRNAQGEFTTSKEFDTRAEAVNLLDMYDVSGMVIKKTSEVVYKKTVHEVAPIPQDVKCDYCNKIINIELLADSCEFDAELGIAWCNSQCKYLWEHAMLVDDENFF